MTTQHVDLVVTHRFGQSAERVFDAWLDPDVARRWLFATPEGEMVRAEVDARVGGRFLFVDRRDGEHVEHFGEYREIDRPRRLVFTFGVTGGEEESIVTVEIASLDVGCELKLTTSVLEEYADRSEQGWGMILRRLEETIS